MNLQKPEHQTQGPISDQVTEMAARLLPIVARKKAAGTIPVNAGSSFFYDIPRGWDADALKKDKDIRVTTTIFELEDAFHDPAIKSILIPRDASITRTVALRVCKRHGHGKTVFFEGSDHE